ncbi:PPR repeat [Musa troglodytarum]|uniref:PPR repeat n=1 Tax=Musa troglodytarum TaxID=320322 RepID=A0A9E7F8A8_9LILI|nr:PPR repeat [Musa troglodytarum]
MPERNGVSCNLLMAGYLHGGFPTQALSVFKLMSFGELLFHPNEYVFATALASCADISALDEGRQCHAYVLKSGLVSHSYVSVGNALINMYSKSGSIDDATKAFTSMLNQDIISWNSIINAYSHFGFAKGALETFHNMLAEEETPTYVTFIGVLSACAHLGLIGYVPNIACASHDVEDEQKEEYLRYHSEKLAIAFGVIHMPPGAAIYIMKNLRMCDDCHVAVKLISIVTNRKLVVRDANRFHCFESGCCSCDDYW